MPALLIINYNVTDSETLEKYRKAARPILSEQFGAKPVVRTAETIDLGEGPAAGTDTIVLEFETVEAATEAFQSEAYLAALPDRLNSIDSKISIIVPTFG